MISAESVEFLPRVYANCWIGWIAWRSSSSFQPPRCGVVQSPYARLTVGVPYLAISSSSSVVTLEVELSASMSTASRVVSSVGTAASSRKPGRTGRRPHPAAPPAHRQGAAPRRALGAGGVDDGLVGVAYPGRRVRDALHAHPPADAEMQPHQHPVLARRRAAGGVLARDQVPLAEHDPQTADAPDRLHDMHVLADDGGDRA